MNWTKYVLSSDGTVQPTILVVNATYQPLTTPYSKSYIEKPIHSRPYEDSHFLDPCAHLPCHGGCKGLRTASLLQVAGPSCGLAAWFFFVNL